MARIYHQDKFATNLTSNQSAGVTTTPLNSIPSVSAPFYIALDATNVNGHYEVVYVSSKTSTNINHAATTYAHTTAEEARLVVPAAEMDDISEAINVTLPSGWISYSTVVPTRASADDPTYVLTFAGVDLTSTIGVGMRLKWTQNSTVRYGIVTAISFSTNTTLTLYGGTDYDVDDTGTYAISSFNYSTQKAPLGFPMQKEKWTHKATYSSSTTQSSPTQSTWYNIGSFSLAIPIGSWEVEYFANYRLNDSATAAYSLYFTLSTANNSESDSEMTCVMSGLGGAIGYAAGHAYKKKPGGITLSSKTSYYLNMQTGDTGVDSYVLTGGTCPVRIVATCAYL